MSEASGIGQEPDGQQQQQQQNVPVLQWTEQQIESIVPAAARDRLQNNVQQLQAVTTEAIDPSLFTDDDFHNIGEAAVAIAHNQHLPIPTFVNSIVSGAAREQVDILNMVLEKTASRVMPQPPPPPPHPVQQFEDWRLDDVFERYGINSAFGLDIFSIHPIPLTESDLQELLKDLNRTQKAFRFASGNEPEKCEYISVFLKHVNQFYPMCRVVKELELCLGTESQLVAKGKADFAIVTRSSELGLSSRGAAIVVVEAKQNDLPQGKAQCMLEMEAAFQYLQRPVFGIATTALLWMILKFDGTKFFEISHPFALVDCVNRDEVAQIAAAINFVFHEQSSTENSFPAKRARQQE